jgi:hypothetical protein
MLSRRCLYSTPLAAFLFATQLVTNEGFAQEGEELPSVNSTEALPEAPASEVPAAQNVLLRIKVKGTGVSLTKVEVKMGEATFFSDPKGEVSISIPPEGDGVAKLFRNGYEPVDIQYSALRPPGEFDIFLYPAISDDNVVVVTGQRRPQVSRKTVSVEESRKIAPGGDPAQVVKLLPGVQTNGFGSDIIVRGSGPRDTRYYIDDLEVPFLFHGVGNLSVIPPALMTEVSFDAGGFGSEYGNATGGVIVIRTKNDVPDRPMTELTANIPFYSGVFHTRPLSEDSSLSVAVRRSYIEVFIDAALKSEEGGGDITLVPYFGDIHAVYLKKNESGHTKFSVLSAYDGVSAAIPSDSFADEDGRASIEFKTSFINLGVEKLNRINRDWKYTTTPQIYYFESNADFVGNAFALDVTTLRVPTEFSKRLSKTEELVFGVDPAVGRADIDLNAIDFRPGDPTFDPEDAPRRRVIVKVPFQAYAAWTSIDKQFGNVLVTPGIRTNYDSLIKKSSYDPRLRARIAINDSNVIKTAVGQYSQSPDPAAASVDFGNPDLKYIRSNHYVLGLETKWGENWVTEFQGFYKTAYDDVRDDPDTRYNNDGSFKSVGGEVFIRRNLTGRLFGWLSYTYSKTQERDTDTEPFRDSRYDQTHVLNVVSSYRLTSVWELGTRYNYHTGDTFTPTNDSVYNANLDKYQPRDKPGDQSSERLPDYNALTFYATKDFLFDTWKMALKFGMESYWPKAQVSGIGYNYDYSKEQEQKGLTAIPFLEVRGEL